MSFKVKLLLRLLLPITLLAYFLVVYVPISYAAVSNNFKLVKQINPSGNAYPARFVTMSGKIYFIADDGTHGNELWVSDGTEAGTHIVKDIFEGTDGSGIYTLFAYNDLLFFSADDNIHEPELWVSDGSESGTHLVKVINPVEGGSYPSNFTVFDSQLYFVAYDGMVGNRLYVTDGTEGGTHIADINPSGGTVTQQMVVIANRLFFFANDGINGIEPWVSDGTILGTSMIANINAIGDSINIFNNNIGAFNNVMYFTADDGIHGLEPWVTDGTEGGTALLVDINPSGNSDNAWFTAAGSHMYFAALDDSHGYELWKSDGPTLGADLVKDINIDGYSDPSRFKSVNNILYFTANDGVHGSELWKSDGTEGGTIMVKDINASVDPDASSANINEINEFNGSLMFTAYSEGETANKLWTSDGTEIGTIRVTEVSHPNGVMANDGIPSVSIGNSFYFSGKDVGENYQLWSLTVSDSSSAESSSNASTQIPDGQRSTTDTPRCSAEKPGTPDLFQVTSVGKRSANIHFSPANDPVSKYSISFGQNIDAEEYGGTLDMGHTDGAITYTLDLLMPNTVYYVKVKAGNHCMPGEWSQTLRFKTSSYASFFPGNQIYPSRQTVIYSPDPVPGGIARIATEPQSLKSPIKKKSKAPSVNSKQKSCFLLWCW